MNKTTRQNTLKAVFDKNKPRPSALNIHRWMDETLRIQDDHLEALQLVGKQNAVYIKLKNKVIFEQLLNKHRGNNKFMLDDNVETVVTISDAKAEYTHVRVFNLPPELENDHISYKLQSYGIIQKIENEYWSSGYKYKVPNGIRSVYMEIKKPIPSNLSVGGHEAYIVYTGQLQTCHTCGETSHFKDRCPYQKFTHKTTVKPRTTLLMSELFPTIADTNTRNQQTSMSAPEKLENKKSENGDTQVATAASLHEEMERDVPDMEDNNIHLPTIEIESLPSPDNEATKNEEPTQKKLKTNKTAEENTEGIIPNTNDDRNQKQ